MDQKKLREFFNRANISITSLNIYLPSVSFIPAALLESSQSKAFLIRYLDP